MEARTWARMGAACGILSIGLSFGGFVLIGSAGYYGQGSLEKGRTSRRADP